MLAEDNQYKLKIKDVSMFDVIIGHAAASISFRSVFSALIVTSRMEHVTRVSCFTVAPSSRYFQAMISVNLKKNIRCHPVEKTCEP